MKKTDYICTRGLHGPGSGRQMKDDFSNGLGRAGKWEVTFPKNQDSKYEVIFPTGRTGQAGKREMSFPIARQGHKKKGKQLILHVSLGQQKKDEVFKQANKGLIITFI